MSFALTLNCQIDKTSQALGLWPTTALCWRDLFHLWKSKNSHNIKYKMMIFWIGVFSPLYLFPPDQSYNHQRCWPVICISGNKSLFSHSRLQPHSSRHRDYYLDIFRYETPRKTDLKKKSKSGPRMWKFVYSYCQTFYSTTLSKRRDDVQGSNSVFHGYNLLFSFDSELLYLKNEFYMRFHLNLLLKGLND